MEKLKENFRFLKNLGDLGVVMRRSWGYFGRSGGRLGTSCGRLERSWSDVGAPGRSWGRHEAILKVSWTIWGASWDILGPS